MLEHFTLKNLYTINDTINKDINTKNVILTPFNSTLKIIMMEVMNQEFMIII